MITLSIDPGIRGCGAALFYSGKLIDAAYVKNSAKTGNGLTEIRAMAIAVSEWHEAQTWQKLVVEMPSVYRPGLGKGDNNDLLILAGVNGALAGLFHKAELVAYRPREWKGQMPKEVCHARVRARLEPGELEIVEAAAKTAGSKAHNLLDAVGLGMYHLKRFDVRKVFSE